MFLKGYFCTYTAKFIEISKQEFWFCKHDVTFYLNFFEWFHINLLEYKGRLINVNDFRNMNMCWWRITIKQSVYSVCEYKLKLTIQVLYLPILTHKKTFWKRHFHKIFIFDILYLHALEPWDNRQEMQFHSEIDPKQLLSSWPPAYWPPRKPHQQPQWQPHSDTCFQNRHPWQ